MSLSGDVLLNFVPHTREVPLIDRNGSVFVRELRASEVIDFSKNRATEPTTAAYKLIQLATVDDNGQPLFTAADIGAIANIPYKVSDTILDAILDLSGMKEDAQKKQPTQSNAEEKSNTTTNSAA